MADRSEGVLSDAQVQREARKADAQARRVNREDLYTLDRNANFRRWFGKYAVPLLMLDIRTSNGGDLQHFMGRRSLVLEMIKEFDDMEQGFYQRVLSARQAFENELRQPQPELEEED